MKVFNDYDFLAKYAKKDNVRKPNQKLAAKIVNELNVDSILDVGGGTSSYLCSFGKEYDTAIIDVSAESLEHVHAKWKIVGALPNIPMQARSFEFVSVLEVIEHIDPSIYKDSLQEISRVSKRFVFITAPFFQDLSAGYVLCDKCGTVFQCEGHVRRFSLKKIEKLQKYFGGLRDLYFIGPYLGSYFFHINKATLKYVVRGFLQVCLKIKYCHPPFTKCPECKHEIFNNYNDYSKAKNTYTTNIRWWKWKDKRIVSSQFGALFDKHLPYIRL